MHSQTSFFLNSSPEFFSEMLTTFSSVIIQRKDCLGAGTFGAVYKAKCDGILCAAKIFHTQQPYLEAVYHPSQKTPNFLPECENLSDLRHPNIVQYLGTWTDPVSNLPVLLMELMDHSLTQFLEKAETSLPFHIQVNICHDIALALSFLHCNGIIHRDLSSNNILMIGDRRAKVTDCGMARLLDKSSCSMDVKMCCGARHYMPPEASQTLARFSDKIDTFSFGVLVLQTATRLAPAPEVKQCDDKNMSCGSWDAGNGVEQLGFSQSEVKRRSDHLQLLKDDDPFLPLVKDCLQDADYRRPSAKELCSRIESIARKNDAIADGISISK